MSAKQKILFIDRDGVILKEPSGNMQIDALEKFAFMPEVFIYLRKIFDFNEYKFVMVTNQDGLGTESFPNETFYPLHNHTIETLKNHGIIFDEIHIDVTFEHENKPTRKPGTAMITHLLDKEKYDLENSYVIGDRKSDMFLAKNIGCKGIWIFNDLHGQADDEALQSVNIKKVFTWKEIYEYLQFNTRCINFERNTSETKIKGNINLDGVGNANINTGLLFFDHMLNQIAKHGLIDITLECKGDLEVDEHHTIEDVGLALGSAFKEALGNKLNIERYAFVLPMDDCLAQVAIDFGGRPWLVWDAKFNREKIGDMPTEMFFHFFKSFSDNAACNLNIKAEGENEHHKIESIFKAFAKCIKQAVHRNIYNGMPSTKGSL